MEKWDTIIAGASFAGLSVARESGEGTLLIDRKEIGSNRTSACGMPYDLLQKIGCEKAALQKFSGLAFIIGKKRFEIEIDPPYCTIDYKKFCRLMRKKTEAEFVKANVLGLEGSTVKTSAEDFQGKAIVDCTGWSAALASSMNKNLVDRKKLSFGIETTIKCRRDKMEFIRDTRIIENGWCWIFPAGRETRFGVASYSGNTQLKPALDRLVKDYGLETGEICGGYIPCGMRKATAGRIFLAGDSAGQAIPFTGEGIKEAIKYGSLCGRTIRKIREGKRTLGEGLAEYRDVVETYRNYFRVMEWVQRNMTRIPEPAIAKLAGLSKIRVLTKYLENKYRKL